MKVQLNYHDYSGSFDGILNKTGIERVEQIKKRFENRKKAYNNCTDISTDAIISVEVSEYSDCVFAHFTENNTEFIANYDLTAVLKIKKSDLPFITELTRKITYLDDDHTTETVLYKDFEKISDKKFERVLKKIM